MGVDWGEYFGTEEPDEIVDIMDRECEYAAELNGSREEEEREAEVEIPEMAEDLITLTIRRLQDNFVKKRSSWTHIQCKDLEVFPKNSNNVYENVLIEDNGALAIAYYYTDKKTDLEKKLNGRLNNCGSDLLLKLTKKSFNEVMKKNFENLTFQLFVKLDWYDLNPSEDDKEYFVFTTTKAKTEVEDDDEDSDGEDNNQEIFYYRKIYTSNNVVDQNEEHAEKIDVLNSTVKMFIQEITELQKDGMMLNAEWYRHLNLRINNSDACEKQHKKLKTYMLPQYASQMLLELLEDFEFRIRTKEMLWYRTTKSDFLIEIEDSTYWNRDCQIGLNEEELDEDEFLGDFYTDKDKGIIIAVDKDDPDKLQIFLRNPEKASFEYKMIYNKKYDTIGICYRTYEAVDTEYISEYGEHYYVTDTQHIHYNHAGMSIGNYVEMKLIPTINRVNSSKLNIDCRTYKKLLEKYQKLNRYEKTPIQFVRKIRSDDGFIDYGEHFKGYDYELPI